MGRWKRVFYRLFVPQYPWRQYYVRDPDELSVEQEANRESRE